MTGRRLGDRDTAAQLLKELVFDLRTTVSQWASLTDQTAQVRMGYVGQHLVSVVTGLKGSKSGARGHDLVDAGGRSKGEIKTCNRVDQLGSCRDCDGRVSASEAACPYCDSTNIDRKNDSKWLLSFSGDEKFEQLQDPEHYYLVLFEPDDVDQPTRIDSKIWRVDPNEAGFALCLADYYLAKRNSPRRAPFNWWPASLKFLLMRPMLIYSGQISLDDGTVSTVVWPDVPVPETLLPFSRTATYISGPTICQLAQRLGATVRPTWSKGKKVEEIDRYIQEQGVGENAVVDAVVQVLYADSVRQNLGDLSGPLCDRLRAMLQ